MKNITVLLLTAFICSCSCKKSTAQAQTVQLISDCPKDGTCSVKLEKNRQITIKQDDFGKTYYSLEESSSQNVITYTYSRTVKGNLQDANYREEIVFELNNDLNNTTLENESLQKTNMLFGRFCFCRGQTGNYKIKEGKLITTEKANQKTISLYFKTDEVPQIINHIEIVIK